MLPRGQAKATHKGSVLLEEKKIKNKKRQKQDVERISWEVEKLIWNEAGPGRGWSQRPLRAVGLTHGRKLEGRDAGSL